MSNADSEKRYTGLVPDPTRPPPFFASENPNANVAIDLDLDDLFSDILPEKVTSISTYTANPLSSTNGRGGNGGPQSSSMFQMAPNTNGGTQNSGRKRTADSAQLKSNGEDDDDSKDLTEQQKLERRERNREHAKRSRLRKKFLLESLQTQIHALEKEVSAFRKCIKEELPDKSVQIITRICGDRDKFTPLPMPSGFGPVKTLMEPDFRLMSALSSSHQNFAISDPTLPDNPIVYVSQGFLDLTGYTLDQVLGRNCRFLQGPGTDQSAVEVMRKGISEGVDTSVCLLNYRADGTTFWNQFFVAALRDDENNVVNYVGVQCAPDSLADAGWPTTDEASARA